jgi:Methyltransferase domain
MLLKRLSRRILGTRLTATGFEGPRVMKPVVPIVAYPDEAEDVTYASIAAWHSSDSFRTTSEMFREYPKLSFVGGIAHQLLYHLVRTMKAREVIEIGTYYAATSEVITRALWENGQGTLHTTDPFGADRCPGIIGRWPAELRRHVTFYPVSSMDLFMDLDRRKVVLDVAFIDGNHDQEFAYFDLCSAARLMRPGGIVVMDNLEQAGVFWAALEFLRANPDWTEIGDSIGKFDPGNPFDDSRLFLGDTPFALLKAPAAFFVKATPRTTGNRPHATRRLSGLRLTMSSPAPKGVLHVQIILRGFSEHQANEQLITSERVPLDGKLELDLMLSAPLVAQPTLRYTAETILYWQPDGHDEPLRLTEAPIVLP